MNPKLTSVTCSGCARVFPRATAMKVSRRSYTVRSEVSTISSASARIAFRLRRSSRIPSSTGRSFASGWGRRVSLKRRTRAASRASRKIRTGLSAGMRLMRRKTRGNCDRKAPSRTSTTMATFSRPEPARLASSAIVGMSIVGRLSTQK